MARDYQKKYIVDFDVMEEASATETYYGFKSAIIGQVANGATHQEASSNWAIMKEVITGTSTRRFWANGTKDRILKWSDRATYTYKY